MTRKKKRFINLRALTLIVICLSIALSLMVMPAEAKSKKRYNFIVRKVLPGGKVKYKKIPAYEEGGNVYFKNKAVKIENAAIIDKNHVAVGTKVLEVNQLFGRLCLGATPTGTAGRFLPARRKDPYYAGVNIGTGKYTVNFYDCAVQRERFRSGKGYWSGLVKIMPGRQYLYVRYKKNSKWKIVIRDYAKK